MRAKTAEQGIARLVDCVAGHGAWHDAVLDESRTRVVLGDLARPRLGLSDDVWGYLAQQVDAIYHCGSLVHFGYPYSALRDPNVLGTVEALRLACAAGRPKRMHYISSLSVFGAATSKGHEVREDAPLPGLGQVHGGYSQSKWASERLCLAAAARGVPVTSHRPGRIVGHSVSGECNTDDFLFRMLKGCVQLGVYPDFAWCERAAPVDFVSAAIVAVSMQRRCGEHHAYHQVHEDAFAWTSLFEWTAAMGYTLVRVPLGEWVETLEAERDAPSDDTPNAMLPLLPLLKEVGLEADVPLFRCDHTLEALEDTPIRCAPMEAELWGRYVEAMHRNGFLPAPAEGD